MDPSEIKKKPEDGCYIQGIYMEGARWDLTKGCLARQLPKDLIFPMPIIHFIPIEANKLKLKSFFFYSLFNKKKRFFKNSCLCHSK